MMVASRCQAQLRAGPRWLTRLISLIWTLRSGSDQPSATMIGSAGCHAALWAILMWGSTRLFPARVGCCPRNCRHRMIMPVGA